MDEQEIIQTGQNAVQESEPVGNSEQLPSEPAPEAPQPELPKDSEIGVNEDGELTISDDFFSEASEAKQQEPEQPEQGLSDDYFRDTPFEQWDESKLTGDVTYYVQFVKEQLARRQAQANFMAQQAELQKQQEAQLPKPYTAKELADDANKLARERLGLDADEEIDMYDPEHYAAMQQAVNELNAQREEQISKAKNLNQAQAQFGQYWADLSSKSYFNDFDSWITGVLNKSGKSPQMLADYIQRTGDFEGAQRVLNTWQNAYLQQKQANRNQVKTNARIPSIENANNAVQTGGRRFNLAAFKEMDDEQQAQALINAGYVTI
ncbi:MAG: hypothetical protein IJ667_10435 [Synergistaceae bacterium]|nr:hypothetical protein [Synergistaceae bacterium]